MFQVLILQTMHALSDERCEYLIKDRLSFMRFLGLGLTDPVPDANTVWTFREALKKANAIDTLFCRFDEALQASGYLAMAGQIIDATIVAAPKQRNTDEEKKAIEQGRIPNGWKDKPAKLRQKDRDARWTVKYTKAKPKESAAPKVDLAIPAFGYKNHVSIDRRHGLIRKWTASDAAAFDGARLADLLDKENTASDVWADTAYRSQKNEEMPGRARLHLAHPSQKAEGPPDAGTHEDRQCEKIEGPFGGRTCVCASEGERSDLPARGSKSVSPISPTTCAALSGLIRKVHPPEATWRIMRRKRERTP